MSKNIKERVISRRSFFSEMLSVGAALGAGAGLNISGKAFGQNSVAKEEKYGPDNPWFKTRGVVLLPSDMKSYPWAEKAKEAGLSTIGTHFGPKDVIAFSETPEGKAFFERCHKLGVELEHELHAMYYLLPRDLFKKDPSMFRMDENGDRTDEGNCCVHSKEAIEIILENVVKVAKKIPSTTGRYFFWIDDGKPMCKCPKCRIYSYSDQALILENKMLFALRKHVNPKATLAHLAYLKTLNPPMQIKPEKGIFLEYAPIARCLDKPLADRGAKRTDNSGNHPSHGEHLDALDKNLAYFGSKDAQVLEYWLDESWYFRAQKPRKIIKLPWYPEVFKSDLATYGKRGIRHITSFAVFLDGKYFEQFGEPPIKEYAQMMLDWTPS
ncbi:MAG: DUF4838 domain-containing protein [Sedimentisphaerales bacterium]|nr:DUF4838 domain-containing protein [Sedimentisphaerales bacterium]